MKESIGRFLSANWGNIASVAGLAVSIVSAVFAKRASVAARAAREAVFRRNFADDMAQAHRVASELSNLVDAGKLDAAFFRCSELEDLSTFIQERWRHQLVESSKQNCAAAGAQLDTVRRVLGKLTKDSTLATSPTMERLTRSCHRVKLIFVEEEAIARRTIDGGEDAR